MKKNFSINQTNYEYFKIFQETISRLENITGLFIMDFEIIYFYHYEEVTDINIDLQFEREIELLIIVPNKRCMNGKTQYKKIHFTVYQDEYEHYDLKIIYEYLSRETIEDMKKLY